MISERVTGAGLRLLNRLDDERSRYAGRLSRAARSGAAHDCTHTRATSIAISHARSS